jgi:beta-lactamase class A
MSNRMNRLTFLASAALPACSTAAREHLAILSAVLISSPRREAVIYARNTDAALPAASLNKLFLLGAYLERAERRATHTAVLSTYRILEDMIARSSNDAANEILRRIGLGDVQRFLHSHGFAATKIHGPYVGSRSAPALGTTSANDAAKLLAMFLPDNTKSPFGIELRQVALALLLRQEDRDMIAAGVPPCIGIANKTGVVEGVRNDAALIAPFSDTPIIAVGLADFSASDDGRILRSFNELGLLASSPSVAEYLRSATCR